MYGDDEVIKLTMISFTLAKTYRFFIESCGNILWIMHIMHILTFHTYVRACL